MQVQKSTELEELIAENNPVKNEKEARNKGVKKNFALGVKVNLVGWLIVKW